MYLNRFKVKFKSKSKEVKLILYLSQLNQGTFLI